MTAPSFRRGLGGSGPTGKARRSAANLATGAVANDEFRIEERLDRVEQLLGARRSGPTREARSASFAESPRGHEVSLFVMRIPRIWSSASYGRRSVEVWRGLGIAIGVSLLSSQNTARGLYIDS
jgi:hypothetical protein